MKNTFKSFVSNETVKQNGGQAILVVVVLIGGIFMVTTALSGLLMFYQIQQSADAGNSTIALFAADAGLERATYCYFYESASNPCDASAGTLSNGGTFTTTVTANPNGFTIDSEGKDAGSRSVRDLERTVLVSGTP